MRYTLRLFSLLAVMLWPSLAFSGDLGIDCPIEGTDPSMAFVDPDVALPDGFIVTSFIGDFAHPKAVMLHFDKSGRLNWERELAGKASTLGDGAGSGNGSYVFTAGAQTSNGSGLVIAKFRPDGSIVWSEFLKGPKAGIWGFATGPDGGGYAAMFVQIPSQVGLIMRFTAGGEISWAKTISVDDYPVIQTIVATQPDGVLIAKTWDVPFDKPRSILLMKFFQDGQLAWSHMISNPERDLLAQDMITLSDGSIVIAGGASGDGAKASDGALIHLDKDGNGLSATALHAPPLGDFKLLSPDADGWLFLGGMTAQGGASLSDPVGPSQPTIARVNADGQVAWAKQEYFGPTGGMTFGMVSENDRIFITGARGDWGPATLLELKSDGSVIGKGWKDGVPIQITSHQMELSITNVPVDSQPIQITAVAAKLDTTEASVKLVPLCSH